MKKSIVRSSMLAVATFSLLAGGVPEAPSIKEQVSKTPEIVGKAIENSNAQVSGAVKGIVVKDLAEATETTEQEETTEATTENATEKVSEEAVDTAVVEEKKAKVESNQVVANIESYLNIREEASEESDVVGKFYTGNVGTVVEKGEQWSLVSSGNAYGYVNNDYLLFGDAAEEYIENNCDQVAKVTADTLNVRAEESTDSEVVTLSDIGDTLTVLGRENGWVKVAVTDEEVGYVSSDFVYVDYVYETAVTIEEEETAAAIAAEREAAERAEAEAQWAEEQAAVEADTATQDSVAEESSTQAPTTETPSTEAPEEEIYDVETSSSSTGQAVADYAVQFVGNPYVYGGTSLTNGADCSGFVQSVYSHFGYSLSRTSQSQAGDGTTVSVDSLQPGDLLFYHGFGHVAIYIGGGQVVHASNAATGIKISAYNYSPIDKAVRIIQ